MHNNIILYNLSSDFRYLYLNTSGILLFVLELQVLMLINAYFSCESTVLPSVVSLEDKKMCIK